MSTPDPEKQLRDLAYSVILAINAISVLDGVRQKDVADALRNIRGHLDARAADADRNHEYDRRFGQPHFGHDEPVGEIVNPHVIEHVPDPELNALLGL